MLHVKITKQFDRDLKKIKRQQKPLHLLEEVMFLLQHRKPLMTKHKDHALTGDYKGFRELHIRPDWLLIYTVQGDILKLERTGSHSELFA